MLVSLAVLVLVAGAGAFAYSKRGKLTGGSNTITKSTTQNRAAYSLDLMNMVGSSGTYSVGKPTELMFSITDKNSNVIKNFDTYQQEKMHFIVVRKDRTHFQDFHPALDETTGMFTVKSLTLPADGYYRIFANFVPDGAKKDSMGMVQEVAPYQDVKVGDVSKYTPQALGTDKLNSSVDGIDTSFFFPPGDDSPGGVVNTNFYANMESTIAVSIDKSGQAYKNLQKYLGALGHLVALGPNLEFVHADSLDGLDTQTGLVAFGLKFPTAGQYKLFLQTKAGNQDTTHDFNLTVQDMPASGSDGMSGMNM